MWKQVAAWALTAAVFLVGLFAFALDFAPAQKFLKDWAEPMGSLVAGVGLVWLIVGYYQQQEELRLNTRALRDQELQLRQHTAALQGQVKATHALATTAVDDLAWAKEEACRRVRPIFSAQDSPKATAVRGVAQGEIRIINRGEECYNVFVDIEQHGVFPTAHHDHWPKGNAKIFAVTVAAGDTTPGLITIRCATLLEDRYTWSAMEVIPTWNRDEVTFHITHRDNLILRQVLKFGSDASRSPPPSPDSSPAPPGSAPAA